MLKWMFCTRTYLRMYSLFFPLYLRDPSMEWTHKKRLRLQWAMEKKMNVVWITRLTITLQIYVYVKCNETDRQLLFMYFFSPKLQIIMKLMLKKGLEARSPVFWFANFFKSWEESYWFQQYVNDIWMYGLFYPPKGTPRMITKDDISITMWGNPAKTLLFLKQRHQAHGPVTPRYCRMLHKKEN